MPSANSWLRAILRISTAIHNVKECMTHSGVIMTIILALAVVVLEVILALASLPSYVFLAPVPVASSRSAKTPVPLSGYRLRRAVTLSAFVGVLAVLTFQLIFGFAAAWFSFGSHSASAANLSWDFNASTDYVYNVNEVQIVDGTAIFRATTLAGTTITIPTSATETTDTTIDNSGVDLEGDEKTTVPDGNDNVNVDTSPDTSTPSTDSGGGTNGVTTGGTTTSNTTGSVDTGVTSPSPDSESTTTDTSTGTTDTPTVTPTVPAAEPTPAPAPEAPAAPAPAPSLLYAPPHHQNFFAASVAYAAELPSAGSTQICESTIRPVLPTVFSDQLSAYTGFVETASKGAGEIYYQLSTDAGITWEWWNGTAWTATILGADGNTANVVNAHIGSLPVTTASLMFKARFHNDCSSDMQLSAISVEYDVATVAPDQTFFTLTALDAGLTFTDSAGNPIAETEREAYIDVDGRHVAYIEATAHVTLSSSRFNISPSSVSVNLGTLITGVGRMWLLVPKNGAEDFIRLCPSALLAADITPGCVGEVTLSASLPVATGFALAHLDDPEYWYVEASLNLPSLGIAETSAATPPTPSATPPDSTVVDTTMPDTTLSSSTSITIIGIVNDETLADDPIIINEPGVISVIADPETGTIELTVGDTTVEAPGALPGSDDQVVVIVIDDNEATVSVGGTIVISTPIPEEIIIVPEDITVPNNEVLIDGVLPDATGEIGIISDVLSPTEINDIVLTVTNIAPSVRVDSAVQGNDGLVVVDYTLLDHESNYVSLPTVQYSLTGAFTGEEQAANNVHTDDRDDGMSGLATSFTGVSHRLVWDASMLSNGINVVFFRIVADDGIESSDPVVFGPVGVDVTAPIITDLLGTQVPDTDTVEVTYTITDAHPSGTAVVFNVSDDQGATWTTAASTETSNGFSWNALADFPNVDNDTVMLRITATDIFGNVSVTTSDTTIDTKAPYGLTGLTLTPMNDSVIVSWDSLIAEAHFDHYTVRYSSESTGSLSEAWNTRDDIDLDNQETTSTVITNLLGGTAYRVMLEARDVFGHTAATSIISISTLAVTAEPDIIAPIVDTLPETTTWTSSGSSTVTIEGSAIPNTTVDILVDSEIIETDVSVDDNGSFETDITLGEGAHVIEVVASLPSTNGEETPVSSEPQTVIVLAPSADDIAIDNTQTASNNGGSRRTPPSSSGTADATIIPIANDVGTSGSDTSSTPRTPSPATSEAQGKTTASTTTVNPTTPVALRDLAVPVQKDFAAVAALNSAKTSRLMPVPSVDTAVPNTTGTTIRLAGSSMPNSKIAIFLHSEQAVMYTTETDNNGNWSFDHEQKNIELAPGLHTVYTIAYDEGSSIKSEPSKIITFEVQSTFLSRIGKYFDLSTTLITLFIALVALGTVLTLRRRSTV